MNYKVLNNMIETYGKNSPDYNKDCKPYAVFDFDNTTIINDVEMSLLAYQIENLRFKIQPDKMFDAITSCLDSIDFEGTAINGMKYNVRALANDITNDYKYLYDNYIQDFNKSNDVSNYSQKLESIRNTDEYLDFRAKLWTLSEISYTSYSYRTSCLWVLKLLNGMTKEEVQNLAVESTEYAISIEHPHNIEWESPEMGECGKAKVSFPRGIKIAPSMIDLFNTLRSNGIEVYICSASLEWIVAAVASNPQFGLNIPKNNVYGLRLAETADGLVNAEFDEKYIQTYKQGKTDAILKYIAPQHCGQSPILTAGDSNGDYEMLTEMINLKYGLIINAGSGGNIATLYKLAEEADSTGVLTSTEGPRYMLQGRNPYEGIFTKSSKSEPFK